jgi:flagellar biosynthetic protein FliR
MDYILLLLLRVSGLIFSSPIFGRQIIPNTVRIGFCLAVTVAMLAGAPVVRTPAANMPSLMVLCLTELLFGVVLGFTTTIFFGLTFTAGNLIDNQMGFGMVNVYDPQSGAQVPITGNLINLALVLVFFTVGGHLRLIEILGTTLERVPIGSVALSKDLGLAAAEAFANSFVLSMHVAMPFLMSGLLAEAALGVIIRTVPQMNMFVVGLPLKVLIGLFMLILVMPAYIDYAPTIFDELFRAIDTMFVQMVPAA